MTSPSIASEGGALGATPLERRGPATGGPTLLVAALLGVVLFSARAGEDGLLYHLHGFDLLALVAVPFILWDHRRIPTVLGEKAGVATLLFLGYALLVSMNMAAYRNYPVWVAVAFAGKEIHVFSLLLFTALYARRHPRAALAGVILPLAALLGFVAWQLVTGDFLGLYGFVGLPGEAGPSQGGATMGMTLLVSVAYFVFWPAVSGMMPIRSRLFPLLMVLVSSIGLLLTLSRAGIGGAMGGLGMLSALIAVRSFRRGDTRIMRVAAGGAVLAVVAATAILTFAPEGLETLERRILEIGSGPSGPGLGRLEKVGMLWDILAADPVALVLGFGMGSPNFVVQPFREFGLMLVVDNQYIRRLFEVGIVGTSLWLLMWATLISRLAPREHDEESFFLVVLGASLATLMFLMSFTQEIFQVSRVGAMFYVLFGIILGAATAPRAAAFSGGKV